jgi:peptidoglycan/LPS O-acetylase OafA/YrhL
MVNDMESGGKRLLYIDNLRVILVILVVISHVAITYGPVGFWYYYERADLVSTCFLAFFISVMQAFLIGLFFMISAFFITPALKKKGPGAFLRDRFKKLGIPLVFYIFIIAPSILYLNNLIIKGERVNYFVFYYEQVLKKGNFDAGPLWFLQVLLFFCVLYVVFSSAGNIFRVVNIKTENRFPSNLNIFITIAALALTNFFIRLQFPISATTRQLNIGLAPQYIFLFGLGILAYKNKWFELITARKAKFWSGVALVAILFWPFFILSNRSSGLTGFDIASIAGGMNWQSFAYSFWEATLSISLSISIIFLFRYRFNHQSWFTWRLSRSTYTVFIIHALIIVLLSYLFRGLSIHPLVKFLLVSMIGIPLCFLVSFYLTRIPFLKKII